MSITYFVHSITTDNELGRATGWLPGELSDEGRRRATALAETLDTATFDAVFVSDLSRATQSAELFFEGKLPVFIDWRLRECNYGDFNGAFAREFKKDREAEHINVPFKNGESYKDVECRIRHFLDDAQDLFPDGHIALVAHQAPQLALEVILSGKNWRQALADDWRKTGAWQPGWSYAMS